MSKKKNNSRWKKPVALALMLLFFFGTTGFTVHVHRCQMEGTTVSLFQSAKCSCAEADGCASCCKDDVKLLKVRGKCFLQKETVQPVNASFLPLIQWCQFLFLATGILATQPFQHIDAVPPRRLYRLFILNRAIRI